MKYIKDFLTSVAFKRFCWLTLDGFIGVLITYFADLHWVYAPLIIAVLANISKWINTTYLQRSPVLKKIL